MSGLLRRLAGESRRTLSRPPIRWLSTYSADAGGGVLNPSPSRSVKIKSCLQPMTFGGHVVYCRTAIEVEQATTDMLEKIKDLKQNAERVSLGLDIEWKPTFIKGSKLGKAAVMQMCIDAEHCYVLHIIHSGITPTLKFILGDCSSVKVGAGVGSDARRIMRDYNVCIEPLEDLSAIANLKLGRMPNSWSLDSLTKTVACKELLKPNNIRLGNWEAHPLSTAQLQYAATDAFASWHIYQVLKSLPDLQSDNASQKKTDIPKKADAVSKEKTNLPKKADAVVKEKTNLPKKVDNVVKEKANRRKKKWKMKQKKSS